MRFLSGLIFGAILLVLPVPEVFADNGPAVSNPEISDLNSPVCYGTTLQASFTANPTTPTNSATELIITNTIWSWSANRWSHKCMH